MYPRKNVRLGAELPSCKRTIFLEYPVPSCFEIIRIISHLKL